MRAVLRQQWTCYKLQLKVLSTSAFEGFLAVLFPLMFAAAALLVYRVRDDPDAMQYAGLGAAIMGMWTAQGVVAASMLSRERWAGTLELVVAAPVGLGRVLLPATLAMSTIGLYSVVATILFERFAFGLRLDIASWPLFVLAVLLTAVTLALVGYFIAVTATRYRYAGTLGATLEYPGWILCGFLIPVASLPVVLQPLSWIIPTTWGMAAIRSAADGGSPWGDLALCAATGAAYAVLAAWLGGRLVDAARRHATLALT